MKYADNQFIVRNGLYWPEILRKDVPKSGTALQPIYEAFTNAIEAIRDKQKIHSNHKGEITIKIFSTESTVKDSFNFSHLTITDNGIGFNDEQFERLNVFRDVRKNYKNLGSGRLQYVHYFDNTTVKSIFEQDGKYFEREFIISKKENFLKENAIVKHRHCKETDAPNTETTVSFSSLLENSGVYNDLNEQTLKEKLLERYIHYFCYNKGKLPKIKIEFYVQSELKRESTISQADIPSIDKTQSVQLQYSKKEKQELKKQTKRKILQLTLSKFQKTC